MKEPFFAPHFLHFVDRVRLHLREINPRRARPRHRAFQRLVGPSQTTPQTKEPVEPSAACLTFCCICRACSLQLVFCFLSQGGREAGKGADGPEGEELALEDVGGASANTIFWFSFTISCEGGRHAQGVCKRQQRHGRPPDALVSCQNVGAKGTSEGRGGCSNQQQPHTQGRLLEGWLCSSHCVKQPPAP